MAAPQTKNLQQTKTPHKTMRRTTRMITTLAPKVVTTDRTNATSKPEDSDDQQTLAPKDVDAKTQRQP
jgi:type II secretory pathway component PulM